MRRLSLTILAILVLPALLVAQSFRMASLAPAGSVWDNNIKQMGAEWQQVSDGRVRLNVFAGGQLGDDRKVVALLRQGRPEAAVLTIDGLSRIDPAFAVLALPFFYESYDELNAVIEALEPTLDARLAEAGFTRLAWGHAGWVRVFSSEPVSTLEDLRGARLYTASDADDMIQWYKTNGFSPVPLASTDILTGLKAGQIDAVPTPPTAAMAFGWFSDVPHMLDVGVAPLIGAIIVNDRAWSRVAAGVRADLEASAASLEARLAEAIPRQDAESIAEMQKRGLTVHQPAGDGWDAIRQSLTESMRGRMVEAALYDQALAARDAYRASR